jgi:hypothetical protein
VLARLTSRKPRCVFPYDLDPGRTVFMMPVVAGTAPVNVTTGS